MSVRSAACAAALACASVALLAFAALPAWSCLPIATLATKDLFLKFLFFLVFLSSWFCSWSGQWPKWAQFIGISLHDETGCTAQNYLKHWNNQFEMMLYFMKPEKLHRKSLNASTIITLITLYTCINKPINDILNERYYIKSNQYYSISYLINIQE